jgi:hypothetical protein
MPPDSQNKHYILRIDYASHYIIRHGILPFSHKLLAMAFSRFPTKFDRLLNLPTDARFEEWQKTRMPISAEHL